MRWSCRASSQTPLGWASWNPVYWSVIGVARTLFAAQGLRFTVTGAENLPRTGGAVVTVNHTGYLDFTYAGLAALRARRLIRFMAKESVFRHPVTGPLMRGMHHIPVDRTAGAGRSARRWSTASRRDRRGLPGGDDLALLRAQGVQDRGGAAGPAGAGVRSCRSRCGAPSGCGPRTIPNGWAAPTCRSSSMSAHRSPSAADEDVETRDRAHPRGHGRGARAAVGGVPTAARRRAGVPAGAAWAAGRRHRSRPRSWTVKSSPRGPPRLATSRHSAGDGHAAHPRGAAAGSPRPEAAGALRQTGPAALRLDAGLPASARTGAAPHGGSGRVLRRVSPPSADLLCQRRVDRDRQRGRVRGQSR